MIQGLVIVPRPPETNSKPDHEVQMQGTSKNPIEAKAQISLPEEGQSHLINQLVKGTPQQRDNRCFDPHGFDPHLPYERHGGVLKKNIVQ
jgi:hypothetical protein